MALPRALSLARKEEYIFGAKGAYYTNQADALANMTTIEIPVWDYDINTGEKVANTMLLEVHVKLAENVTTIFDDIFKNKEKFVIRDVEGFCWKNDEINIKQRSHHSYGTAIDINVNENYLLNKGGIVKGSLYLPNININSMAETSSVVQTFKKYGWFWGGNRASSRNYSHLTYLGK